MEIYTNAPSTLDVAGCKVFGDFGLGLLRVVSMIGAQTSAKAQVAKYKKCGFFASLHRNDAIEFITQQGSLEDPSISDFRMQARESTR